MSFCCQKDLRRITKKFQSSFKKVSQRIPLLQLLIVAFIAIVSFDFWIIPGLAKSSSTPKVPENFQQQPLGLLPGWPQAIDTKISGSVNEAMFIATDLDNDGKNEIFSQSPGEYVYLWDYTGKPLPNFPKYISRSSLINPEYKASTPAVADLIGDGQKEIIFVVNIYDDIMPVPWQCAPPNKPCGLSAIYAIRKDGSNLPGFPIINEEHYLKYSAPVISDINQDGRLVLDQIKVI